jgi:hypothetical protein
MTQHLTYQLKAAGQKMKLRAWPVVVRLAGPAIWLRRRLRPQKISLCRMEGVAAAGGLPLAIRCGAEHQQKEYLRQLFFTGVTRETEPVTIRQSDAFRPQNGRNCGLVILETHQGLYEWLNDGGWFFLPQWVRGTVELPIAEKTLRNDTFRSIRRRIRQQEFEYTAVRTAEQFKDFYDNMHVPYITGTHGTAAVMRSHAELWARASEAGFDLIMVRKLSQPGVFLSGCLMIYEAEGPRLWTVGVRDGNIELVREGALSALYLFCFEHLVKQGFARVNLGGSRPFLQDGVLTLKKRLSQTISSGTWEGFALKVMELTPATRAFLAGNPFLFRIKDRFHGAVFSGAPLTAKTVVELERTHFYPGMDKLRLYFFEWNDQFRAADLPPEVAARVEVRKAAELVSSSRAISRATVSAS